MLWQVLALLMQVGSVAVAVTALRVARRNKRDERYEDLAREAGKVFVERWDVVGHVTKGSVVGRPDLSMPASYQAWVREEVRHHGDELLLQSDVVVANRSSVPIRTVLLDLRVIGRYGWQSCPALSTTFDCIGPGERTSLSLFTHDLPEPMARRVDVWFGAWEGEVWVTPSDGMPSRMSFHLTRWDQRVMAVQRWIPGYRAYALWSFRRRRGKEDRQIDRLNPIPARSLPKVLESDGVGGRSPLRSRQRSG